MGDYLIGIDVGTSGSKALLVGPRGDLIAAAGFSYPMRTPKPLWAEQDPRDWWEATVSAIRAVMRESGIRPSAVAGVGLTGQMHGLVLLGRRGEVLRPCIMWNDQRTAAECAEITATVGADRLLRCTGNPVLPGFTAPKVAWVRRHEPQVYSSVSKVLLPKDYVRYRLTGAFRSDVSDASGTSLFDVGRRSWSEEMISAVGIDRHWLPEVTESQEVSGGISAGAAGEAGLPDGTPVVGGAGDQAAQALGTGVIREGLISATLGTSGVVFAASDEYRVEPSGRLHAYCHAVPGMWHLMGVMLSAAGSLRWFRDALGGAEAAEARESGRDVYDILVDKAASAPPGCEGLIFLPYLTGERTPHPDPDARGVFFGLTLRHGKAHMVRAVLEGVGYGLRDSLELMRGLGVPVEEVRVSGGGARSALWRRILADIFNAELTTINVTEGAAYGAALLAGIGAGIFKDAAEACSRAVRVQGRETPGPDAPLYDDYYPRYRALYPALAGEFAALAETSARHAAGD